MYVYLEEFKSLSKVTFYSFRLENEELTEADRFYDRFYPSSEYREELSIVSAWIKTIGNERGAFPAFDEKLFRYEGKNNAVALPPTTEYGNRLRLYGCICSDDVVILGGGGRKTARTAQGGEDTSQHHRLITQVAEVIRSKIADGSIWIENKQLHGAYERLSLPG